MGKVKFFGIDVEPWYGDERDKGSEQGPVVKFRTLLGDSNSSYGQKPGKKDDLVIRYNGVAPNLPFYSRW